MTKIIEPKPRTFWRVFERINGVEAFCPAFPRMAKNPDDFALAVADLSAAGRSLCIRPTKFTADDAVAAIAKGASAEEIQQYTDWSDEEMNSIQQAAGSGV